MKNSFTQSYTDQSSTALRHTLIKGPVDLGQFNVLQQGCFRIDDPDIRITARIIGASHLLTFEFDGRIYHELFACDKYQSDQEYVLLKCQFDRKHIAASLTLDRLDYSFEATQVPFSFADSWLYDFEVQAAACSRGPHTDSVGLAFDFPASQPVEILGKTIILARFDENRKEINIKTAHSYPNEGIIVKSISLVQLRKEREDHQFNEFRRLKRRRYDKRTLAAESGKYDSLG